ncbi:MAG TPA: hypothetical protein VGL81_26880 [Polyangiaceae bacterium]|jgi:hypothetical protein
MRPPKYPLEPLAKLRGEQADAAVQGLAKAVAGRDAAERDRRSAEQRRDAHEVAASRVRGAEQEALARGELRVGDLARAGAWESRVASEGETMASAVARAQGAEGRAREVEQSAQGELATRRADVDVVAADRARWHDALRRKREAREEEAAEEAFRRKP